MTWIGIVPPESAGPELRRLYDELRRLYPEEYGPDVPAVTRPEGGSDSVTAAHSLIPEAMFHAMATLGVLLRPGLPLTRRQHEMIATVVSAHNRCFY
jgi:hypothetical protein